MKLIPHSKEAVDRFFYTYSLPLSPRRHAKHLVGSSFPMTGFLRSRSGTTPNYWAALEFTNSPPIFD